ITPYGFLWAAAIGVQSYSAKWRLYGQMDHFRVADHRLPVTAFREPESFCRSVRAHRYRSQDELLRVEFLQVSDGRHGRRSLSTRVAKRDSCRKASNSGSPMLMILMTRS